MTDSDQYPGPGLERAQGEEWGENVDQNYLKHIFIAASSWDQNLPLSPPFPTSKMYILSTKHFVHVLKLGLLDKHLTSIATTKGSKWSAKRFYDIFYPAGVRVDTWDQTQIVTKRIKL